MNTERIKKATAWLASDARQRRPLLANTIFDRKELNEFVELGLTDSQAEELMLHLERVHWIVRTNKMGANGFYYNVAPSVFRSLHPDRDTKVFVHQLRVLNDGYCVVASKRRLYKLSCKAKKCRFYLDSQGRCFRNKFFI